MIVTPPPTLAAMEVDAEKQLVSLQNVLVGGVQLDTFFYNIE